MGGERDVKGEIDAIDRRLLNEMQERFPLVRRPFAELAGRLRLSEDEVIARVGALRASGVVRQVGPIFDSGALGYSSSLVAMRVPEGRLAAAAEAVSGHPGVSHNYRRSHDFNLWFTIAVPAGADLQAHVHALHTLAHAESTRPLPALETFKIGVSLDMTGERPIDARSAGGAAPLRRAAALPLTPHEIDVVRRTQADLPVTGDPFADAARDLGMTPDALVEELAAMREQGILRRVAAILRHRDAGFGANAMVVWDVPDRRAHAAGRALATYAAVSHCYRRPRYADWRYNIFTMVHGRARAECEAFVERASRAHGLTRYAVLYSTTEYKKVRLRYFTPEFTEWQRAHLGGPVARGA